MRKHCILFLILAWSLSLHAQPPQAFRYQAVARDAMGGILPNRNVTFRISVILGSPSGSVVYSEIHEKLRMISVWWTWPSETGFSRVAPLVR